MALPEITAVDGSVPAAIERIGTDLPDLPARVPGVLAYGIQPCALAAGIAIVLMIVGLHPFVAPLVAGFLATVFARRRFGAMAFPKGSGASLGALTGLILFATSTILETLAVAVLHKGAEMRAEMIDKVQQAVSRYPGADAQSLIELAKSPNGFAAMLIASLVVGLILFVIFGMLGGVLGVTILGRRS
ncbi:MAG TPA: hypothetical protein VND65_06515 [Candidatus Binatia bacterium]|nr:hypothetical protein [Candidatus Binatia bacterium]